MWVVISNHLKRLNNITSIIIINHYVYYHPSGCTNRNVSIRIRTRNTADRPLDHQTTAATTHTTR